MWGCIPHKLGPRTSQSCRPPQIFRSHMKNHKHENIIILCFGQCCLSRVIGLSGTQPVPQVQVAICESRTLFFFWKLKRTVEFHRKSSSAWLLSSFLPSFLYFLPSFLPSGTLKKRKFLGWKNGVESKRKTTFKGRKMTKRSDSTPDSQWWMQNRRRNAVIQNTSPCRQWTVVQSRISALLPRGIAENTEEN